MKTVLSQKAAKGLLVVDSLKLAKISTKAVADSLKTIKAEGKVLLVGSDEKLVKSATNIEALEVRALNNISVYDILNANTMVISEEDVKALEGGLK
jgi:large subunit ribosomal protein L4